MLPWINLCWTDVCLALLRLMHIKWSVWPFSSLKDTLKWILKNNSIEHQLHEHVNLICLDGCWCHTSSQKMSIFRGHWWMSGFGSGWIPCCMCVWQFRSLDSHQTTIYHLQHRTLKLWGWWKQKGSPSCPPQLQSAVPRVTDPCSPILMPALDETLLR